MACLFGNRDQTRLVADRPEQNGARREQLGKQQVQLANDPCRRVAANGKPLGRRLLDRVAITVTRDTPLRWQRKLVATHHPCPLHARPGRPGLMKSVRSLSAHGNQQRQLAPPETRSGSTKVSAISCSGQPAMNR
ncbi:MAG: hypothetical protein ACI9SE_004895 [Neolewinella sp.]|jgi:hypothetical protein